MKDLRLKEAIRKFLDWAEANNRPMTVYCYRLHLNRFLAFAGDLWLSELTPALLTSWRRTFHPLQAVQRLASWCHKCDRSIENNPLMGMRKVKTGTRKRVFERFEEVAILRRADLRFRAVAVALRESIARPQEIRAVRWTDLRQAGGIAWTPGELLKGRCLFMLDDAKGFNLRSDEDALRIIPVSPRFGRLLWRLWIRGVDAKSPIFLNRLRKPWTSNAVRCQMRKLAKLAGIEPDRRGERIVAYTFRHTGATRAVIAGIRDKKLAEWMGHSTTRMIARYVHLTAADLLDAAQVVWEAKTPSRGKIDAPGSLRTHPNDARRVSEPLQTPYVVR